MAYQYDPNNFWEVSNKPDRMKTGQAAQSGFLQNVFAGMPVEHEGGERAEGYEWQQNPGGTWGTVRMSPSPTAPSASAQPSTPDPFASMGGGVAVNGGWVPRDHPAAAGASASGGTGAIVPGTTQGGIPPASAILTRPDVSVTGIGGTSSVSTSPGGQTTGVAPTIPLGPTVNNPMQALMREKIMGLLGTDPTAASISDPDLAPQAQTYSAARERERRRQQEAAAERFGGMGLGSSGAMDTSIARGQESAGQDIAGYEAGLVGEKMQQRQKTLEGAIQAASALGMQEEAANLSRQLAGLNAQMQTMGFGMGQQTQKFQEAVTNMDTQTKTYLANLDADLRKQGFSTSERIATMDAELRRYGIDVQGNLGLLNAVIQMIGMGQQNTQFNDTLGWDMAQFGFNANNGLIAEMLKG